MLLSRRRCIDNRPRGGLKGEVNFDDQLFRYFGTADLGAVTLDALAAGTERMRVDFGLEQNKERRFALWTLLYTLGGAPDLDVAFEDEADRNFARDVMDILGAAGEE
jgi:hypothetical protein